MTTTSVKEFDCHSLSICENVSLQAYHTFGLAVTARYFTEVATLERLRAVLTAFKNQPRLVLGSGSNLLFTRDFDGLVIKINLDGISIVQETATQVWLRAGAGVIWHDLVMHCVEAGWGGIENLSLIPGTVGAAPIQNIGAYGVELADIFDSLEAISITDLCLRTFKRADCLFGYRDSIFKHDLKDRFVITNVILCLSKQPVFNTTYGAIAQTLQETSGGALSLRAVSDAVCRIRRSKLPDPTRIGNAGSFFQNPTVDSVQFDALRAVYADIPGYPDQTRRVKVPAGWLIEQCGWKGFRCGDAGVYDKQALVLVNYGQATANEVLAIARQIQESVAAKFGIQLIPEVNFV